ncbi:MAG: hypothetical protein JSR33_09675, partial [Proteobacteria bacterium]|nr:hypothetical protein [Pseudomonadota bacterium]
MKKILILPHLLLMFIFFTSQALAYQFLRQGNYDYLQIKNSKNSTEIYIKNYTGKSFLIYKSNFIFPENAVISAMKEKNEDIIWLDFDCSKTNSLVSCSRFFNRRTNQMSEIYKDLLSYNQKENVIANYLKHNNLVILTPLFKKCTHPLIYKINLYPNTDFGVKTQFLNNGNLQLDYVDSNNNPVLK